MMACAADKRKLANDILWVSAFYVGDAAQSLTQRCRAVNTVTPVGARLPAIGCAAVVNQRMHSFRLELSPAF
jgi:hypothetical protein